MEIATLTVNAVNAGAAPIPVITISVEEFRVHVGYAPVELLLKPVVATQLGVA